MKKLLILLTLTLSSCTYGDLEPNRAELYDIGGNICQEKPQNCINGVPW